MNLCGFSERSYGPGREQLGGPRPSCGMKLGHDVFYMDANFGRRRGRLLPKDDGVSELRVADQMTLTRSCPQ